MPLQKLKQRQLGPDEDVRQVWQTLKAVLEELDQQCWSEDESEAGMQDGKGCLDTAHGPLEAASDLAENIPSSGALSPCLPSHIRPGTIGPPDSAAHTDEATSVTHLQTGGALRSAPHGSNPANEGGSGPPGEGASDGPGAIAQRHSAPVLVRLGSVCEVVLQWGRSLVGSNLESLQYLLMRLHSAARQHKVFASQLKSVSDKLEADVVQLYGGRISLKPGRLQWG